MENTAENYRRIPPRSKFNDEESTAVLRLIVEQERLLKHPSNPVLNITSDKLKRLPPLNSTLQDSIDCAGFEQHRNQRKYKSDEEIVLSRPTLLKGKELRASEETATFGRPKVPEIFSTPKIARPRDRERPRASYGRNSQMRCRSEIFTRTKSAEEYHSDNATVPDTDVDRPSNPTPLEHQVDFGHEENASKNSKNKRIYYESEDDMIDTEQLAPYIN